jgi:ribosomal protein S18 acetylase RimI-like enzyme
MLLSKSYHHFLIKKNVLTVGLVSYKPSKKGYIISIIIKKKYRNKNYAYTAIKMSLSNKEIINKKVLAIVKKNNINSIRLFRKLKFSLNSKKKLYMKLS